MDLTDYLRILRRRWPIILVPILLGLTFAWLTTPEPSKVSSAPLGRTYTATATLVLDPNDVAASDGTGAYLVDLDTVSLFTRLGEIPKLAAKQLKYGGEPQVLAAGVDASVETDTNSLRISTGGRNGAEAAAVANAFASATVAYFHDQRVSRARGALKANETRADSVGAELQAAARSAGGDTTDLVARSKVDALQPQYTALLSASSRLRQVIQSDGPLEVLQRAVPVPQDSGGLAAPTSPIGRLALSGLVTLLLGLALALVIDRFDTRIRSRRAAETAFGLPVLAEIPRAPRSAGRGDSVVSQAVPSSEYAEAYRELRSATMLLPAVVSSHHRLHRPGDEPMAILVTSPRREEGRSTVVADLATVMAEAGQQVLVLSMDLRHPAVDEMLGAEGGAGLAELTARDSNHDLSSLVQETSVPGVEIVCAGGVDGQPRALLLSAEKLIAEARRCADVVLIDSPAVLESADAGDLAQFCDVTLVVSRQGRTNKEAAAELRSRFERVNVEAHGVVMVGADRAAGRTSLSRSVDPTGSPSPEVDPAPFETKDEKGSRRRVSTKSDSRGGVRRVS